MWRPRPVRWVRNRLSRWRVGRQLRRAERTAAQAHRKADAASKPVREDQGVARATLAKAEMLDKSSRIHMLLIGAPPEVGVVDLNRELDRINTLIGKDVDVTKELQNVEAKVRQRLGIR